MAFDNFKGKTFTVVTASTATTHKDLYRKTPSVLRQGAKEKTNGGFFNYDLILSASDKNLSASFYDDNAVLIEQDTGSKEVAVYLTASIFRDNMDDFLQKTAGFSSSSYAQFSSSFFSQIGEAVSNISASDAYVAVLAAPFEPGSVGSGSAIIGPATSSIITKELPGLATDTAGNQRQRKITYQNNSSNFTNSHFFFNLDELNSTSNFGDDEQEAATDALVAAGKSHLTRSFTSFADQSARDDFYYVQSKPIPEFSIEMTSSNNTSSFYALTASFSGAADFGVLSGSFIGKLLDTSSITPKPHNLINDSDGAWNFVVQKGIVEGEGEFSYGEESQTTQSLFSEGMVYGENKSTTPQLLAVWYPTNYSYTNVRSASYYFTPYLENLRDFNVGEKTRDILTGSISTNKESGSGELRTVYWLNHTYTSSFTGSFGHFTRGQLKDKTGDAAHYQLPYLAQSRNHLWKDVNLSQPVDRGYYIHSSSFTSQSKATMANQLGSENHTGSFHVMGVFDLPFLIVGGVSGLPNIDINVVSASQHDSPNLNDRQWMEFGRKPSTMFLVNHDNTVTSGQFPYNGSSYPSSFNLRNVKNVPFS